MRGRKYMPILAAAAVFLVGACEPEANEYDELEMDDAPVAEEMAGEDVAYAQWDTDGNRMLSREEFGPWYADRRVFTDWDADDEEGLNRDEFAGGLVGEWDEDDSDRLNETEWSTGAQRVFGDTEYGAFADWDADGDSELDANEVAEGFETHGLYDRVDGDRDALIDDEELADWFFDLFDANDDDELDTTEWESTWLQGR